MSVAARRQRQPDAAAERRLAERDSLARVYFGDLRRRTRALRDGPDGPRVCELMRFMKSMTLRDGGALVARVEAADWARRWSAPDRLLLLQIIGGAIRVLREREGLPGLDDPMFDGPASVRERCKQILGVR